MKSNKYKLILSLLVSLGLLSAPAAKADVILHAFNWKYSEVADRAEEIAELGYSVVLVSPPLRSTGDQWWARYQPQDYRVLDNPLGNKADFVRMIEQLKQRNVRVYADIVLNHMANEAALRSDLNYPGEKVLSEYQSNPEATAANRLFGSPNVNLFSASDFHSPGCITNYNDVWQVQHLRLCGGDGDTGLPDLDDNSWVISQQRNYLKALKGLGVTGFRVDAAKHMTNQHINAVFTTSIKSGMHVFGEIITSGGAGTQEYDAFLTPYLRGTGHGAYDFPLFSTLRKAFAFNGSLRQLVNPLAFGQALQNDKAITFTVTHDIPNNEGFRNLIMNENDEQLAYAYLLGRDGGSPLVYSDHNESNDNGRWVDAHKKNNLPAMIRFHNATRGESMQIIGATDCLLIFKRGKKGVVGINKCDQGSNYWIDTQHFELNWFKDYKDVISGDVRNISSRWHDFYIPARSARLWLEQ
ncbi:MAG: alpha-amylase family protein [Endozoicomonas sp.]|uniref:alpha-amylase family protein n=1 Tax=Endozoicomonas sp. TaxID=1892382 RepID=UPI003D9B8F5A